MSSGAASASGNGGAPAGPREEVSLGRAWWAGWSLLFTRLPSLFAVVLIPAILAYGLETSAFAEKIAKSNQLVNIFGLQLLNVALYSLMAVGAYAVAFGKLGGRALLHLHVGRAELNFFGAKLIFWGFLFLMYVGASIVAQQILIVLKSTDAVISAASAQASDAEWVRQLTLLGAVALYGPLAIAATVFMWFGARFALVFPYTMATGRLRVFEAMALTKRRSWSLFALLGSLGAQLIAIYMLAGWYGGFGPYGLANRSAAKAPPAAVSQYVFGKSAAPAGVKKPIPKWVDPVSLVLLGAVWQIVFAGALASAYRDLAPEEEGGV